MLCLTCAAHTWHPYAPNLPPRPQAWFADNASWLVPYAAYSWLRQLFGTAEHWRWGAMSKPSPELLERVTGPGGQLYQRARTFKAHVHA